MKNPITAKSIEKLGNLLNAHSDYQLAKIVEKAAPNLNRYRNGKVSITLESLGDMAKKGGYEIEINFIKIK